ncbi:MAG: cysteine-rich CWC family protein [Dysgonomonas sp.]
MKKICPHCGKIFECRHDNIIRCHCVNIYLTPEMKSFIAENYQSCLCLNCLKDIKESFHKRNIEPLKNIKL